MSVGPSKSKKSFAVVPQLREAPETPDVMALFRDMLRADIRAELASAMAAAKVPEYVPDVTAAQHFDVSVPTLVELARKGAPHVIIGERRRWNLPALAAWLHERSAPKAGV